MGALHAGHRALAERAVERCDAAATTIFVNPTQFAPHEDLARYPRTLEDDLRLLRQAGMNAVFVPDGEPIYGPDFSTYVLPPAVGETLEGEKRPEHFRGVTTVVTKLFHILPCTHAFFGQKDYQQARVLQQMTEDLDFGIELELVPTVREPDGLALSSRNRYLSPGDRDRALGLSRALSAARDAFAAGERQRATLEALMQQRLFAAGVESVDYAVVVDRWQLRSHREADDDAIALIAAHVGSTRLIDNRFLGT